MKNNWKILGLMIIIAGFHWWLASNLIVRNYGISFGFEGLFLLILNLFLVIFLGYWTWNKDWRWKLIFMGGFLNLLDRIIFGYVRDYWNFLGLGLYNNINDWIIGIGTLFSLKEVLCKK